MTSLFGDNQANIIKAFNLKFRYLDDPYFKGMANHIYPPGAAVAQW